MTLKITHIQRVFLIIIIILVFHQCRIKDHKCYAQSYGLAENFSGVVLDKFADSTNHNFDAIIIRNNEKDIKSYLFDGDITSLYETIQIGDSLVKKEGDLSLMVYRNKSFQIKKLDYGCESPS